MNRIFNFCFLVSFMLFAGMRIMQDSSDAGAPPPGEGYWRTQTTGFADQTISALSVVNRNVCWIAGASGRIIRTTNGGRTWSFINSGIIDTQDIDAIEGVNENIAFTATRWNDTTHLYRTTDGGSSWSLVFSQSGGYMKGIAMFDLAKGIAMGEPVGGRWTIIKTTDSGATWVRIPGEPLQIGSAREGSGFKIFDTNYVWFFDRYGRWYSATRNGDMWSYSTDTTKKVTMTARFWTNAFFFGLCVFDYSMYRYNRGWTRVGEYFDFFPITPQSDLIGALGTYEYWLLRDELYYSSDFGSTWTNESPHGLSKLIKFIDIVTLDGEITAWAIGEGDTVYHYNRMVTGVSEPLQELPEEYSLSQNYPNPFNPSTMISYTLPARSHVTLKVYDLLGSEVATLVDGIQDAGYRTQEWNASKFPSGIYFYKIEARGLSEAEKAFVGVKKMGVIK